MKNHSGFTITELAMAVAIFAVLSAIAIPGVIGWRNNAMLRGAVITLAGDLAAAKQSAIRRNANVVVDFSANNYMIFIDNGDGTADADANGIPDGLANRVQDGSERILRNRIMPAGVVINLTSTTFSGDSTQFDKMGRCPAADVGTVVITRNSDQNAINLNRLGRIDVI